MQTAQPTNEAIWSVSALNFEVKQMLNRGMGAIWIEGEISNFARPASGHWYFTLKDDLSDEDRQRFDDGLTSLTTIDTVRHSFIGTPADTDRPIIDRAYTYGLVLTFDDVEGHDAYQVDPVHDAFRDTCSAFWSQVRIFDMETA